MTHVACGKFALDAVPAAEALMYIPAARERVEVVNCSEVFLVVSVDRENQSVDLVALSGPPYFAENVPFAILRPYQPRVPLEAN